MTNFRPAALSEMDFRPIAFSEIDFRPKALGEMVQFAVKSWIQKEMSIKVEPLF